ncbi:hypothetical protein CC80DRAFT_495495 [Byssothecium circinans]|uniref:MFS general substrate transporter n=1 Tax=Byssothecium circinans TaxID=147558 RepID=A0A6A5TJ29_9PLEO|nr:hypothetical protein CC80DRAFT_495495 [Byssothecium circinans]
MGYTIVSIKAADYVAEAISFMNCAQLGSTVIALTLASLIFQNVGYHNVKGALVGSNAHAGEIRAALGGVDSRILKEGLNAEMKLAVERGIVDALRWSFVIVLVASAFGVVTSLGMKREPLFKESGGEAAEVKEQVGMNNQICLPPKHRTKTADPSTSPTNLQSGLGTQQPNSRCLQPPKIQTQSPRAPSPTRALLQHISSPPRQHLRENPSHYLWCAPFILSCVSSQSHVPKNPPSNTSYTSP